MRIDNGAISNRVNYSEPVKAEPKADVKVNTEIPAAEAAAQKAVTENPVKEQSNAAFQQDGQKNDENTQRRLQSAVDHANQTMKHARTKCEFSYHEETKRVSIKIIDEETKETVREIPPEETLDMLAKMWELAGILVDEKR